MFSEQAIGPKVKNLNLLIKRTIEKEIECHQSDCDPITSVQGFIIHYLYGHQNEDVFQRDIEKACQISRSTVTGILKLMEKKGLITRQAVESDARLKKLALTQRGIEHNELVMDALKHIEERLCQDIPPEDLTVFLRTMDKMIENLKRGETQSD